MGDIAALMFVGGVLVLATPWRWVASVVMALGGLILVLQAM